MLRSTVSKVMWVGRTTAAVIGLAVALALVVGVSTTALAAIPGDPFRLGQTNGIDAMSTLVGNVAGPMLRLDNSSTGRGATALDLRVEAGKPPMKVNSGAKVANLNADRLDGRDSSTYLPGNLPSGTTLRGTFGEVDVAQNTAYGQYAAISFGYSVSPAPTAHYVRVGDPTPVGCTGNAGNPGAEPGHLCIFEKGSFNLTFRNTFEVTSSGALVALGAAAANTYYAYGTWAVTAP